MKAKALDIRDQLGRGLDDKPVPSDETNAITQPERRRAAIEQLAQNVAPGGLTLDEYSARAVALEEAATPDEIDAALVGLAEAADTAPIRYRRWLVAGFGGAKQRGRWRLSSRLRVVSVFSGVSLDLGRAELEAPESLISVIAVFGGAELLAPSGVSMQLSGLSLFGGKGDKRRAAPPLSGTPLIRVRAFVLFGGVTIKDRRTWMLRRMLRRISGRNGEPARA